MRLHIWHAYSTNDALSNYLVTLTLTVVLKIVFFGLCCRKGHSGSQTHVFFLGLSINKDGHSGF